jgi:hypothetical protein
VSPVRPRPRALLVLGLAAAIAGGAIESAQVIAQYGAPSGAGQPDPSRCQVEPRPIDFFAEIAATPRATLVALATPEPAPAGAGEPADAATVAAIEAAVAELAACRSTGDALRLNALYTDRFFLRQTAAQGPPSDAALAILAASPAPPPVARQSGTVTVRDVEVLSDGRVRAVIDLDLARGGASLLTVFVREGDRWLIDEEMAVP